MFHFLHCHLPVNRGMGCLAARLLAAAEAAAELAASLLTTTETHLGLGLGGLSHCQHIEVESAIDIGGNAYGLLSDDAVLNGDLHGGLLLGSLGSGHIDGLSWFGDGKRGGDL